MIVPAVRTPFTPRELVDAFEAAWPAQMGGDPLANKGPIAVLCGQVALETGNGSRCYNHNVGNYKAYAGVDGMDLKTWEVVDGVDVPQVCLFAAYPALSDGVQRFLALQSERWPAAWHQACQGDPRGYALALAAQHPPYYTADPEVYARGCEAWYAHYAAILAGDPSPTLPDLAGLVFRGLELPDA